MPRLNLYEGRFVLCAPFLRIETPRMERASRRRIDRIRRIALEDNLRPTISGLVVGTFDMRASCMGVAAWQIGVPQERIPLRDLHTSARSSY